MLPQERRCRDPADVSVVSSFCVAETGKQAAMFAGRALYVILAVSDSTSRLGTIWRLQLVVGFRDVNAAAA